jgi:hypothetical protein
VVERQCRLGPVAAVRPSDNDHRQREGSAKTARRFVDRRLDRAMALLRVVVAFRVGHGNQEAGRQTGLLFAMPA